MFYLVQGKDRSRGSRVAVGAGVSGGSCAHINHRPRSHAHTHTHTDKGMHAYTME